jgi:homoserine O-acetyltransferase/O-succinyltransferase
MPGRLCIPMYTFAMRKCASSFVLALFLVVATLAGLAQQPPVDGQQQFADIGTCKLASGQNIAACRLGYRTWGTLNAQRSNAVLFPTWFSGSSRDVQDSVGANNLVDPAKYFIIAVDALGDGVSSSPSNSTAQPGPLFPAFTTRDMVNAEYRLATETLHLTHVHAVMGISMGGMQTFEWVVNYPGFMDVAVPIVGSTRLTGYDLLLWQGEEDALKADPSWHEGHYSQAPILGAVKLLHEMNLTTPAHYAQNHPPEMFPSGYAAYFSKGILPFDANDWLAQLEAMIHHDVAHGGTLEKAAKHVQAKVLVVVAAQDHKVNPKPALDFAALLGAKTLVLDSDCGHLSPGCESEKLSPAVRAFLDGR